MDNLDYVNLLEGDGSSNISFTPQNLSNSTTDDVFFSQFLSEYEVGDSLESYSGQNGWKKPRISRACEMCRKKKVRCDGSLPRCGPCLNSNSSCVFRLVEKKRTWARSHKYVSRLENRLVRMEKILQRHGLLCGEEIENSNPDSIEEQTANTNSTECPSNAKSLSDRTRGPCGTSFANQSQPSIPLHENHSASNNHQSPTSSGSRGRQDTDEVEDETDDAATQLSQLVSNNAGESRYLGHSTVFSIFSNKGIQWTNLQLGNRLFQEAVEATVSETEENCMYWKPQIFEDMFTKPRTGSLPPKDIAAALVANYFQNFNNIFPLYHEPTFMYLFERQYSDDPFEENSWWASINVVLAISYRIRLHSCPDDDQQAWKYMKNALSVFSELAMRHTDLLGVQALLAMALFIQWSPNPQASYTITAVAVRCAHAIGLHVRSPVRFHPVEIEQRRRVFWIAYFLDTDECLRSGRPPAQNEIDIDLELPSENPSDRLGNVTLSDGTKTNLFRIMCQLAVITGKVYTLLYSRQASQKRYEEKLQAVFQLDQELEAWKESIPLEFRPEYDSNIELTPLTVHILGLHLRYYDLLISIHRCCTKNGLWGVSRIVVYDRQVFDSLPLRPKSFSPETLCASAARHSMKIIDKLPQENYMYAWMVLYYPISALITLFAHLLQNSSETTSNSDLQQMSRAATFVTTVCSNEGSESNGKLASLCSTIVDITQAFMNKSPTLEHRNRKRSRTTRRPGPVTRQTIREKSKRTAVHTPQQTQPLSGNDDQVDVDIMTSAQLRFDKPPQRQTAVDILQSPTLNDNLWEFRQFDQWDSVDENIPDAFDLWMGTRDLD